MTKVAPFFVVLYNDMYIMSVKNIIDQFGKVCNTTLCIPVCTTWGICVGLRQDDDVAIFWV